MKTRTVKELKRQVTTYVLFNDGNRILINTVKSHLDNSTVTHVHELKGFDKLGELIYNPDGMIIGKEETDKKCNVSHNIHKDKFLSKMQDKTKYNRYINALKD